MADMPETVVVFSDKTLKEVREGIFSGMELCLPEAKRVCEKALEDGYAPKGCNPDRCKAVYITFSHKRA